MAHVTFEGVKRGGTPPKSLPSRAGHSFVTAGFSTNGEPPEGSSRSMAGGNGGAALSSDTFPRSSLRRGPFRPLDRALQNAEVVTEREDLPLPRGARLRKEANRETRSAGQRGRTEVEARTTTLNGSVRSALTRTTEWASV
jgi:hypothetical protein